MFEDGWDDGSPPVQQGSNSRYPLYVQTVDPDRTPTDLPEYIYQSYLDHARVSDQNFVNRWGTGLDAQLVFVSYISPIVG